MWTTILYILLGWFLYNLIFKFIIPVYRASRKMKEQFRQMQDQMHQRQETQASQAPPPRPTSKPKPAGDYIDFEEIK